MPKVGDSLFRHQGESRPLGSNDGRRIRRGAVRDILVDAIESIAKIRELLELAEAGTLGDDLGSWLSSRIRDYLENASEGRHLKNTSICF